jgi:TRAP-type C4-dicarboxylate transport system permease small subunit
LRHIEVEFLKARVSAHVKYKMNMATSFLASVFLVIFAIIGFKYVGRSIELADVDLVLSIPLWIIILIIPISFTISALRFFCSIFLWLDVLKGIRKEEEIIKKQIL